MIESQNFAFYTNKNSKSKPTANESGEHSFVKHDFSSNPCQICKIKGHTTNTCRWRYTPSSKDNSKASSKGGSSNASSFGSTSTSSADSLQQAFHSIKLTHQMYVLIQMLLLHGLLILEMQVT